MTWLTIGPGLDKRLDRLEDELARLKAAGREASLELRQAGAEVEELGRALEQGATEDALAIATGGPAPAERRKLHADYAKAKERPDVLGRKLRGIEQAIASKETELTGFVSEHNAELFEAHVPACAQAREDIAEAAATLTAALGAWNAAEQRTLRLVAGNPALSPHEVPGHGLDSLPNELARAGDVPLPLPRSLLAAPENDPTIRSAA